MCTFNEIELQMFHVTHLLPRGYLHNKNEMIAVNIVEVTEQTQIHLQTDGKMDEQDETNIPQQLCVW